MSKQHITKQPETHFYDIFDDTLEHNILLRGTGRVLARHLRQGLVRKRHVSQHSHRLLQQVETMTMHAPKLKIQFWCKRSCLISNTNTGCEWVWGEETVTPTTAKTEHSSTGGGKVEGGGEAIISIAGLLRLIDYQPRTDINLGCYFYHSLPEPKKVRKRTASALSTWPLSLRGKVNSVGRRQANVTNRASSRNTCGKWPRTGDFGGEVS